MVAIAHNLAHRVPTKQTQIQGETPKASGCDDAILFIIFVLFFLCVVRFFSPFWLLLFRCIFLDFTTCGALYFASGLCCVEFAKTLASLPV